LQEEVLILGDTFPEIRSKKDHIKKVIRSEEEHFNRTLDRGLDIFEKIKSELIQKKQNVIPGTEVFKLYDTYGFPMDLTRVLADESDMQIDEAGFEKEMKKQQKRARDAAKFNAVHVDSKDWIVVSDCESSNFVGYLEDSIETHIVKYQIQGYKLNIVLKNTPFYAEAGGQVGDTGILSFEGFDVQVIDTQKDADEIIHICNLPENFEIKNDRVIATVKSQIRRLTEKNHTATHLLHAALRQILGDHVEQRGSLVEADRLRFDFTHLEKVSDEKIAEIEQLVNYKIQNNIPLEIAQDSLDNAKKRGAMSLFGEKYGELVRTVQISDYSLELCGGTHVKSTGEIGPFIIVYEGSIAAGIRRIETLTGKAAVDYMQQSRDSVQKIGELLNTKSELIETKIFSLLEEKKQLEKDLNKLSSANVLTQIDEIIKSSETINGINLVSKTMNNLTMDQLKEIGDKIREKSENTVALIGTQNEDKLAFVCTVSDDLIKYKKLKAGDLVREVAKVAGGGGGGKPHLATAGGKDISKFEEAMNKISELI